MFGHHLDSDHEKLAPFVSWPRNAWRSSAQLCPNYSLPKPFVSGQTTNDSNKAREDADGDEENKKKKTRHREIERQRRKEMNTLYASLRSLLPAQILKGKRTISDQLNVALDYINQIQRNIKKLETERARLKKINNELKGDADAGLGYQEVMSTGSCSISVQPYSSGGVEIVVHSSHEEKPLPLSGVIQVLVDEGMDVVCCAKQDTTLSPKKRLLSANSCGSRSKRTIPFLELLRRILGHILINGAICGNIAMRSTSKPLVSWGAVMRNPITILKRDKGLNLFVRVRYNPFSQEAPFRGKTMHAEFKANNTSWRVSLSELGPYPHHPACIITQSGFII
ncbi:hypothetical protein CRG98_041271 [Punica granatum]|uniref:BHLH domain-containing protein n=1 Tax=Punica granatum TaxID=22663 RepID=A0A2I0I3S3_PUNGR|nr:hypothetical protein CRG98_041271 [Punica granatum]